ncbi:MAG: hypothetical protein HYU66_00340 [Armatimonadetes bacterium]|nr:hypothetical protein [Armatimonadota bacterium]
MSGAAERPLSEERLPLAYYFGEDGLVTGAIGISVLLLCFLSNDLPNAVVYGLPLTLWGAWAIWDYRHHPLGPFPVEDHTADVAETDVWLRLRGWPAVLGVWVEHGEICVRTRAGLVKLADVFPECDPLSAARQVHRVMRERGAPDGAGVVDGDRIRRWLSLNEGGRLICRPRHGGRRAIVASDAGIAIHDGRQKHYFGWRDVRDLGLRRPERGKVYRWQLVTRAGLFEFGGDWLGAGMLVRAVEYALAAAHTGHPLPAAAGAGVPSGAISRMAGEVDRAKRGISRA